MALNISSSQDDLARLRIADLRQLFRVSRTTVYKRIADGSLPPPRRVAGVPSWSVGEIRRYVERQEAGK
jgi:predicted DNA-binding transcriptional regulator AlpA